MGVQPATPAPAACPAEQHGGYTFTAARFVVVESACEGGGKVTSFGNWMRPVSCTIDTDCPQLYQFNEPLWFECRRSLCQATTAADTELVSETEAFLLCYGPYPRSETLTPLSPGGMEVSARVSAACPTAGQPCRVPPQCLAP